MSWLQTSPGQNSYCIQVSRRKKPNQHPQWKVILNAMETGIWRPIGFMHAHVFNTNLNFSNKNEIMNAWIGMKTWKNKQGPYWQWTDGSYVRYSLKQSIDSKPNGANVARLLKYQGQPQGAFDTTKNHKYPFVCKKRINACMYNWYFIIVIPTRPPIRKPRVRPVSRLAPPSFWG
jgi:hypothetical protein